MSTDNYTLPPPPAPVLEEQGDDRGPGRPPIYPWDRWLNGRQAWIVTPGVDFTCTVTSFIAQVRRNARKRGMVPHYDYGDSDQIEDAEWVMLWATEGNE